MVAGNERGAMMEMEKGLEEQESVWVVQPPNNNNNNNKNPVCMFKVRIKG